MNCANWEERIALYMGGDLEAVEAVAVERHLAECAGCQLFASGMRESLALLHDAHAQEPGEAAYAAVRARVLGELERRPARRWIFGLAVTAVAAALIGLVWMRPAKQVTVARHESPAPAQAVAPRPAPAPMIAAQPAVVPVVRRARHRRAPVSAPAPVVRAAAPAKPLVVKMVTDDPDVVIYWITDTRGE